MIKLIKINDLIYQNYEERYIDESGNEVWNIPNTLQELLPIVLDTINWWVGDKVKNATGDFTRLSAANSKAIALLFKIVDSLQPDTSNLTEKEQSAYNAMKALADAGYSDSDLLNSSIQAVNEYIQRGEQLAGQAMQAQSVEELIGVLNQLD